MGTGCFLQPDWRKIGFSATGNLQNGKYTKENERILYDYSVNEIIRCGFRITSSAIKIFGKNLDGNNWENEYKYWFTNDTLGWGMGILR